MNSKYSKAIFALAISIASLVYGAPRLDNATDLIQLGILVVGGPVLVYLTTNTTGKVLQYGKAIVAFAVAGATALVPFLTQGHALDYSQWGIVLTAALGAIGVSIVSNSVSKVAVIGTPVVKTLDLKTPTAYVTSETATSNPASEIPRASD